MVAMFPWDQRRDNYNRQDGMNRDQWVDIGRLMPMTASNGFTRLQNMVLHSAVI